MFAFVTNNVLNGIFACFLKSQILIINGKKDIREVLMKLQCAFFQDCLARGKHKNLTNRVFFVVVVDVVLVL